MQIGVTRILNLRIASATTLLNRGRFSSSKDEGVATSYPRPRLIMKPTSSFMFIGDQTRSRIIRSEIARTKKGGR